MIRTAELRRLKTETPGLEVFEFSPSHLRLIGKILVDYWPSTGRAWITDSAEPTFEQIEPCDVVTLAMEGTWAPTH